MICGADPPLRWPAGVLREPERGGQKKSMRLKIKFLTEHKRGSSSLDLAFEEAQAVTMRDFIHEIASAEDDAS